MKYQLQSFNTHYYTENIIEKEINKKTKEGWKIISMILLPNGWTRFLFEHEPKS